ncbi:MAG: TetR/AcrR family transcriptional regulator [Acidimicrobiales bacterium]
MKKSVDGATTTRRRILEAGISLWQTQDPAVLFGGFSVARVADTAHVTRSTFYSYWPTTAEYLRDLAAYLIELGATNYAVPTSSPPPQSPTEVSLTDLPGQIILACTNVLTSATEDPTLSLRLAFLSKSDEPQIAELLRTVYAQSDNSLVTPLSLSLDGWGRDIREPFDIQTISIIFSTLVEGLAARHRLDPTAFSMELYGWTVVALLLMVTKRTDDHRGIPEIVESINSWPAMGLAAKLRDHQSSPEAKTAGVNSASMRDVTVAVRRLLATIGFGELTISEIAARTGYSELTLQQIFGSLPGVAMCVLFINTFERYQQIDPNVLGIDRLRLLIAINRNELQRNPAMAQNMMMLLSGHTAFPRMDLINFDPRPSYLAAVKEAIESGDLHSDLDPDAFSELLQRTALVEASPLAASTSSIIDTVELVLVGAGAKAKTKAVAAKSVAPL